MRTTRPPASARCTATRIFCNASLLTRVISSRMCRLNTAVMGLFVQPQIACVTYLSDCGAPTVVAPITPQPFVSSGGTKGGMPVPSGSARDGTKAWHERWRDCDRDDVDKGIVHISHPRVGKRECYLALTAPHGHPACVQLSAAS